jgi:hypothetical protein
VCVCVCVVVVVVVVVMLMASTASAVYALQANLNTSREEGSRHLVDVLGERTNLLSSKALLDGSFGLHGKGANC